MLETENINIKRHERTELGPREVMSMKSFDIGTRPRESVKKIRVDTASIYQHPQRRRKLETTPTTADIQTLRELDKPASDVTVRNTAPHYFT